MRRISTVLTLCCCYGNGSDTPSYSSPFTEKGATTFAQQTMQCYTETYIGDIGCTMAVYRGVKPNGRKKTRRAYNSTRYGYARGKERTEFVPLSEYAESHDISKSQVLSRIKWKRIEAVTFKGKLYVRDCE